MLRNAWPFVRALSIGLEVFGLLCLIRVLTPGAWGRYAWAVSGLLSLGWSMFWFSGWRQLLGGLL
jgi:hypothetical protein